VYTLLADLPEHGQLNSKEVSALGVAPINCDIGKLRGKLDSRRQGLRQDSTLYGDTELCSVQSVIKGFYQNSVAKGKFKKVALTACMRNLLRH